MSEPTVSFVILSYNYGRFIGETITSILEQQGDHDFEIVIVDDASTDDSDEVIRRFKDPRINYIKHDRNRGHAVTVTDGLRATRGRLVARIDSDDRYRPTFLNQMVPLFAEYPEIGLAYGDAAMIDDDGRLTAGQLDVVHAGSDYKGSEYVQLLEQNFICAPTIIARREAWLQALPIPPWLVFHDWYFTLMIGRHHEFYFRSAVLADYRVHARNYHSFISANKSEESSVMGFLDLLYGTPERDAALERAKQAARSRVYGSHYLQLAQKYFWLRLNADARRCFWRALRLRPEYARRPAVLRQFAATLVGRGVYERVKAGIKHS